MILYAMGQVPHKVNGGHRDNTPEPELDGGVSLYVARILCADCWFPINEVVCIFDVTGRTAALCICVSRGGESATECVPFRPTKYGISGEKTPRKLKAYRRVG